MAFARRRRHHDGVGDHPGPPGGQDPTGRGDAPRARVRGAAAPSASSPASSSRSSASSPFIIGLFVQPGGTPGLIALAGGGGLLIFLGVASVSSTVARPVTKLIGWPVAKLFKTPGVLARENAGRSPRRTSATAAALMIGVALVSAAAVFASSIRATFTDALERSVKADYIITDESFQGLPPTVADTLSQVPELVGGDRRARHDGARSTASRRRSAPSTRWPSSSSSTST